VGRDRIPDILILADAQRHKAHLFSYDQNMNKLAAKVGVAVLSVESSSCRSKKRFFSSVRSFDKHKLIRR
jgi:hypothetical protein